MMIDIGKQFLSWDTGRVDGPVWIARPIKTSYISKRWYCYKLGTVSRSDGPASIIKDDRVHGGVSRRMCNNGNTILDEWFDQHEIHPFDMTDEEVLIVQMNLG